ncbi:M20/M25/M40 family metallo-hydrolase [Hymenobacter sp. GOD-10R]|uniref:M20/M25/M40 family metallo-hydrolase n=1 Tax=Hymenobacter sp. GOD-10R TaxID=3093922 RepID=UPI002D7658B2|nr:M20/M25/M40 family metallo-hydrolase [Hymenobacter sp. GOD-10R]WRQ27388.1 M20/M25/M40 family metallo-hydrolase [Hymenobacter sp. GOD-10R]
MRKRLLLACAFAGTFAAHAQKLTATEKKIVATVQQNMPQSEKLLVQVVNINSGTLNVKGVREVGDIFRKQFDAIGFKTSWVDMPAEMQRAGHLVAQRKGKKGKKLFLIGHLDTVFELDMPFTKYTQLNDSTATGQGVNDMKGGDVVMLAALQALQQNGLLDNTTITAYFTGDEERSGKGEAARADFIAKAKESEVALAFESAAGLHSVATARRGSSGWQLKTTGQAAHSSTIFKPNVGYGAVYEAARILNEFREKLSQEQYLTFNPGLIVGGSEVKYDAAKAHGEVVGKTNIISPEVDVAGDLRFLTEQQKEDARTKMREIVSHSLPNTKAEITFTDGLPGMPPTPGNQKLATLTDQVSRDLGFGPVTAGDPGSRGAGDVSLVAQYLDCLDGLGSSGKGAHAPGETINTKEFPLLVQRAALMIYRLTR